MHKSRVVNFLHDLWTQHKMSRIKINIYSLMQYTNSSTQFESDTRHIKAVNFLYDLQTRHELNTKLTG
jgi:hypothetical protein